MVGRAIHQETWQELAKKVNKGSNNKRVSAFGANRSQFGEN